jgi:hypothetical protein
MALSTRKKYRHEMQYSSLLNCTVSLMGRIVLVLCLAVDIILLRRGVNDNSPCTKHLVVVNVRATDGLETKHVPMWVYVVLATRNRFHSSSPQ